MGGPTIYCGGGAGRSQIRHTEDVETFDSNYRFYSLYCGSEFKTLYASSWFELDLLSELGYSNVSGNEKNLGSYRHQLMLRPGVSMYFWNNYFIVAKLGVGLGINHMNFGRGVPLEDELTFNVQGIAIGGYKHTLNSGLSIAVFAGVVGGMAVTRPTYEHRAVVFGFQVGGWFAREQKPRAYRYADIGDRKPRTCPACPTPVLPRPPVPRAPCDGMFGLVRCIEFPNDNPDVVGLQPSWYETHGKRVKCHENSALNTIMRTVYRWNRNLLFRRAKGRDTEVIIVLRVRGYANNTGDRGRQNKLALGRSRAVIDYLTKATAKSQLMSVFPGLSVKRLQELQAKYGANLRQFHVCGPQSADGSVSYSLQGLVVKHPEKTTPAAMTPKTHGHIVVINDNVLHPMDAMRALMADFGDRVDAKNPTFRRVRLTFEVWKHGKPLPKEDGQWFLHHLNEE